MPKASPDDLAYAKIQKKYDFPIPEDYRKMRDQDWMTLEKPFDPKIFYIPGPHYLWLNEMEWYRPQEIADFKFYDHMEPIPGLVPFAHTGGGDWWCWQTDHVTKKWGTRVLLCWHDSYDAVIYGANFKSALFRQTLELASTSLNHGFKRQPITDEMKEKAEETRTLLKRFSIDLALIFPPEWCAVLAELSKRKATWWSYTVPNGRVFQCYSLLTNTERAKIESVHVAFPKMDKEIRWNH